MSPVPSVLAAFVSPSLFAAGAAVVAAPILIHLLARRRFKRVRWAAMEFLLEAQRRNRRRVRLEEWLLLALRCLAILCVALLVARPFLKPGRLAAALGGTRQTERIIVLDDSFSMGYRHGVAARATASQPAGDAPRTSFALAKVAARRLVGAIRTESPDDTVTILRMSDPSSAMETAVYLDDRRTEALLARLEALKPSNRTIDVAAVVEGVREHLRRSEAILSAAVYFVSDFQRKDWAVAQGSTSGSTGPAREPEQGEEGRGGVFDPLMEWADSDRAMSIVCINVGDADAENSATVDLKIAEGQLVAGMSGTLTADLANYAAAARRDLQLTLSLGQATQLIEHIPELGPYQKRAVALSASFPQAGQEWIRADLTPDRLALDDVRYAVAEVTDAVRVLLVNGEPSSELIQDEVGFLATALRPEGEVWSGFEPTIVDETQLETMDIERFHAVVLANVYRLGEPAVASLERFARDGGGVLIFLGDQTDPEQYNAQLFRQGDGLLPAALGEVVRRTEPARLAVVDPLHPTMRAQSREGDPLGIGRIAFLAYIRCQVLEDRADGGQSGDSSAPSRSETGRAGAHVIARFDDGLDSPAIIERGFGKGRVILVTTSADKEWNRWADHPAYLPTVHELVRYVARSGVAGPSALIGAAIQLALDPAVYEAEARVRMPGYPEEPEVVVRASPGKEDGGLTLRWRQTDAPGIYQFHLRTLDGREERRLVAVNPDPRESDLTRCGQRELRGAAGDVEFDYVDGLDDLSDLTGEARIELWRVILIGIVIVLMTEQSLAWYWGMRR